MEQWERALAARDFCLRSHQPEVSCRLLSPDQVFVIFFVDKRQRGPSGASRHAAALRAENVEVNQGAMGELTVDLGRFGWFPDVLPSEAGLVESSDEENEEEAAYHT